MYVRQCSYGHQRVALGSWFSSSALDSGIKLRLFDLSAKRFYLTEPAHLPSVDFIAHQSLNPLSTPLQN